MSEKILDTFADARTKIIAVFVELPAVVSLYFFGGLIVDSVIFAVVLLSLVVNSVDYIIENGFPYSPLDIFLVVAITIVIGRGVHSVVVQSLQNSDKILFLIGVITAGFLLRWGVISLTKRAQLKNFGPPEASSQD